MKNKILTNSLYFQMLKIIDLQLDDKMSDKLVSIGSYIFEPMADKFEELVDEPIGEIYDQVDNSLRDLSENKK